MCSVILTQKKLPAVSLFVFDALFRPHNTIDMAPLPQTKAMQAWQLLSLASAKVISPPTKKGGPTLWYEPLLRHGQIAAGSGGNRKFYEEPEKKRG